MLATPVISSNARDCLNHLGLGLKAAAAVANGHTDFYAGSATLVINMLVAARKSAGKSNSKIDV